MEKQDIKDENIKGLIKYIYYLESLNTPPIYNEGLSSI
jgi:hypothetical protein